MDCDNLTKYLSVKDFECVGIMAKHCDLNKLCIAAEEAKNFDLIPLFCFAFVDDVLTNWNLESTDENLAEYTKYKELICGSVYTDSNNVKQQNPGFKKLWVYYTYSRYVLINNYSDTANGIVQKQNDFSIPTPGRELNDFSNKYRNMASLSYRSLLNYLCKNSKIFSTFDDCHCNLSCGCSGNCTCGKTKKLTGFKFRTIKKNGF